MIAYYMRTENWNKRVGCTDATQLEVKLINLTW